MPPSRGLERELAGLREEWAPDAFEIEVLDVAPRKSDIGVRRIALAWIRDAVPD